jgi:hypothetical protein
MIKIQIVRRVSQKEMLALNGTCQKNYDLNLKIILKDKTIDITMILNNSHVNKLLMTAQTVEVPMFIPISPNSPTTP